MSSPARIWLQAARPRTLPAAIAPVVMGAALAARDGAFAPVAAGVALLGALLIQVGTNFANDYYDGVKGTDTEERLGPQRAVQAGLVTPGAMRGAFVATFAAALVAGAWLTWHAGWPVAVLGSLALLFGVLYTGGPRPLGYLGLGDVLVLVFFGPAATAGTYYVQALAWSPTAAVAGLGPGLLATALLTVNNLRDVDGDRVAGKRTLAVRLGARFAQAEFAACVLGAAAVPVVLWLGFAGPPLVLLATGACVLSLPSLRAVAAWRTGARLTSTLAATGRLLVVYAAAFSLGWAL